MKTKGQAARAILRRALVILLVEVMRLAAATAPAILMAAILVPMAYAERGRPGIGGEWLAVIFVFGATYWAACKRISIKNFGRRR